MTGAFLRTKTMIHTKTLTGEFLKTKIKHYGGTISLSPLSTIHHKICYISNLNHPL